MLIDESKLEDGRPAQSKYIGLLPCTNREPACHSNEKLLGRVALGLDDCCCHHRPSSMVSLFLDFAAEIVGLMVAGWGCPDNSYYVSSVLTRAVEAHLERGFGLN